MEISENKYHRNKIEPITMLFVLLVLILVACNNADEKNSDKKMPTMNLKKMTSLFCSDACKAGNKSTDISCKLTTPELQKRKETVIANLKTQVADVKELKEGYAFKFPGTDEVLDDLVEFIKTERECCDFFTFNLSISGDKSEAWLELTGAEGAKDFITTELELTN